MKNILKNKKGFTLVELLAVIVILALLIVITANTILPLLGRTKETGMTTYAERVLNNAVTSLEADKVVEEELEAGDVKFYRIKNDLTDNDSYFGCVKVNATSSGYTYEIKMFTNKDELYLYSTAAINDITNLSGKIDFTKYEDATKKGKRTLDTVEGACPYNNDYPADEDGGNDAADTAWASLTVETGA